MSNRHILKAVFPSAIFLSRFKRLVLGFGRRRPLRRVLSVIFGSGFDDKHIVMVL
jgi:hypothetical protein